MKRIVLIFGLVAGGIMSLMMRRTFGKTDLSG
jgi:hypothetical protein